MLLEQAGPLGPGVLLGPAVLLVQEEQAVLVASREPVELLVRAERPDQVERQARVVLAAQAAALATHSPVA